MDNNIDIGMVSDHELCEKINTTAPDFKDGDLLDELTYRTGIDFVDHNSGDFIEALVYVAMEKLGYTE